MTKASKWIAVYFISIALIVGAILAFVFLKPEPSIDDFIDSYDQDIKVINETHPIKLLIFGEPVQFRKEVKYLTVEQLSKDVLTLGDDNYERIVLVVNDLKGTVTLSQEDLDIISNAVNKGDIDFYYFGKNNRERLISSGIRGGDLAVEGDLALVRVLSKNKMKNIHGVWTEQEEIISQSNEELLGQIIIMNIVDCIKSNN